MKHTARRSIPMAAPAAVCLLVFGAGGCVNHVPTRAAVDQPMPAHLQLAMDSGRPTFGVGDELGWLAFGDMALAPLPAEPTSVLVVAQAEPAEDASFNWVGTYLALAD